MQHCQARTENNILHIIYTSDDIKKENQEKNVKTERFVWEKFSQTKNCTVSWVDNGTGFTINNTENRGSSGPNQGN
jgi:hypothetical protein